MMYEGDEDLNIYEGYRDLVNAKLGYLMMYIELGITTLAGCNASLGLDTSAIQAKYGPVFNGLVERIQRFDAYARRSVEETLLSNTYTLIKENSGVSRYSMAI